MTRIDTVLNEFPILKALVSKYDFINRACPDDFIKTETMRNDGCSGVQCRDCWYSEIDEEALHD